MLHRASPSLTQWLGSFLGFAWGLPFFAAFLSILAVSLSILFTSEISKYFRGLLLGVIILWASRREPEVYTVG